MKAGERKDHIFFCAGERDISLICIYIERDKLLIFKEVGISVYK